MNVKSVPRLAWVLMAAALALVAIFVLFPAPGAGKDTPRLRDAATESTVKIVALSAPAAPIPAPRTLASYARLRQRPLFKPLVLTKTGFTSPVPGKDTLGLQPLGGFAGLPAMGSGLFALPSGKPLPVQKTLGAWAYVGYTSVDGEAGAVVENKAEHQGRAVRVGDVIEEATVTGISPENLRMTRKDKPFLLQKTDPTEPTKAPAGATPAPGATPGTPAPAAPPAGNASPPPGAAPASSPAPPVLAPPPVAPGAVMDGMRAEKSSAIRKL